MLELSQDIKLIQRLTLSPKLINMFRFLSLSYPDLIQEINKEAQENIALEVNEQDRILNFAKKNKDFYNNNSLDNLENIKIEQNLNLETHLLEQIEALDIQEIEKKIALELISEINSKGFIEKYQQVEANIIQKLKVKKSKIKKVLKIIQDLEPEGIASRSLKEYLLFQLKNYNFQDKRLDSIIEETIKNHFHLIKNYKELAIKLNIDNNGAKNLVAFIEKNFSLIPNQNFTKEKTQLLIPSLLLDKNYKIINLEQNAGPVVSISQKYLKMLDNPSIDLESKKFIKLKIKQAKEFIENLDNRYKLINKIIAIVNEKQVLSFKEGLQWLNPLQQNRLAELLNVNVSTINRCISGKYIQFKNKVLPLKILLPRDFKGHTSIKIKYLIREILNKNPKLSDQKITDILNENNFNIKRRTVNKYRLEIKNR